MKFTPISLATSIAIVSICAAVNFSIIDATTASMTSLPPNQLISLNEVEDFKFGLAIVKLDGKSIYINKAGKTIWAGEPR
jgi:hypothetical protein